MIYKRPDLQVLCAPHPLGDQLVSEPLSELAGVGLHARNSKQLTQRNVGWDPLNITNVGKQVAPPRSAEISSNTPTRKKVNVAAALVWLVSPGVRPSYAEGGALLFDIKNGRCYSLNGVAARVWVTIEGSPAGISLEGIVDVLETHLEVAREELERAARNCLADLQLARLVAKKASEGEAPFVNPMSGSAPRGTRSRESKQEDRAAAQPFVQKLETLESLVDRLFPHGVDHSMDWRVNKLKAAIDNAPAEVNESLGHVCSQLQLSLTERQARRLFKEAAGISMKDYARKRRLVLAAEQLQDTNEPIKLLATIAGYHTYQGFRKAFCDMFRLTPVEFRKFWQRRNVAA